MSSRQKSLNNIILKINSTHMVNYASKSEKGCMVSLKLEKNANNQFQENLINLGYRQSKTVNGLWLHKSQDTKFTLVVNNFGVKYT